MLQRKENGNGLTIAHPNCEFPEPSYSNTGVQLRGVCAKVFSNFTCLFTLSMELSGKDKAMSEQVLDKEEEWSGS